MNHYIYAQILNMQAMAKTFGQSCELAAMKDDGQISKDEVKQLKRIKAAVEAFCKELDKVKAAGGGFIFCMMLQQRAKTPGRITLQ